MLKLLLKKQIAEFFRNFFYDFKNNKNKSKVQIIRSVVLFAILMLFVAGTFAVVESQICKPFSDFDMMWMYFLLLSALGLFMGIFGSVFNTYSGLYLSKDNDLLISMPIPIKYIVGSRIYGVYLMGLMYSGLVTVPTVLIGFVYNGITLLNVIGGITYVFIISAITLVLSCILGWIVAKLSSKLKNKSYVSTIMMLAGIGAYYYGYSKINSLIQNIIENAEIISRQVQGKAYALYLFGSVGEGNLFAVLVYLTVTVIITALTVVILSKTFLKIATATSDRKKSKYVVREHRSRSAFGALLQKEFARFTSSATYMVNCSMGIILIPVAGVAVLIKAREISEAFASVFGNSGIMVLFACGIICLINCGNDMVAPSVSLEGKNIWIPQSMPVDTKTVLRAKLSVNLILSVVSSVVGSVLFSIAFAKTVADVLFILFVPLVFDLFFACFDLLFGIKMPMMNWTNEIYPIKQSGGIVFALFGGWIISIVAFGGYFLLMKYIPIWAYLSFITVLFAVLSHIIYKWLMNKGTKIFSEL